MYELNEEYRSYIDTLGLCDYNEKYHVRDESKAIIKIATEFKDVVGALHLVYCEYLKKGFIEPNRFKLYLTPFYLLPTTEIHIVIVNDVVVSTVSLVKDGDFGLPMQRIFGECVENCHRRGVPCGESTCIVNLSDNRRSSFSLLAKLMSFNMQCAVLRDIDEMFITHHPRHTDFYRKFFGFVQVGDKREYPAVNNNFAVAMMLNLSDLHINYPRGYKNAYRYEVNDEDLQYRPMSNQCKLEIGKMINTK